MENEFLSPGRRHVVDTMERFHLCTHIPIKAIDQDGLIINTEGYNHMTESIFRSANIMDRIDEELDKSDHKASLIISIDNIDFTVIYICPKTVDRGVYILGPYTSSPTTKNDTLHKPSNCIPHIITLLRNLAEDTDFIRLKKESPYSLYVKKALDYIDTKFAEPITVESISQFLGISKCYFCSIFKKDTNKTFTQVLNEKRIEKSKQLLKETGLSILDISISIGYNNQNYYNMLFKKSTGLTPYQYRNKKPDQTSTAP